MKVAPLLFLCLTACMTDNAPSPVYTAGRQAIERYYTCVRTSAAAQMVERAKARRAQDGNFIAETAFASCQTEEATIATLSAGADLSPYETQAIVLKHRIALKQEIVSATNPK